MSNSTSGDFGLDLSTVHNEEPYSTQLIHCMLTLQGTSSKDTVKNDYTIFNSLCIVLRFIQHNDSALKTLLDHILSGLW